MSDARPHSEFVPPEWGVPRFFARLDGADYLSLGALLVAWASVLLLVSGEPNLGIIAMFGAFGLDKLDGFYARRWGECTALGRQIDSYIDIFTYLVPAALLFHLTIAPHPAVGALVGFGLVAFGGLRLIRHVDEGFGDDGGTSYYRGLTVVHANAVVLVNYLLIAYGVGLDWPVTVGWNGWLAGVTTLAVAPLMLSNYRSYKTDARHLAVGLFGLVVIGLVVWLEVGAGGPLR